MKPTYRVKDWDKHFENHESRKVKRSYWVPIPNRHDGKSYRRIAAHSEGVAVFAAWILILEAASKMPVRGVLADEDGPLDADDLASMTGFPAAIFESAFKFLTEDKVGWLSAEEPRTRKRRQSVTSRDATESPGISRNIPASPDGTGSSAVEQNRTELHGTEGKDTEQNSANAGAESGASGNGKRQQNFDIWELGVGKLMATGTAEEHARSYIGKLRNDYGGDALSEAINKMLQTNPVNPRAYLIGILRGVARADPRTKSKADHSIDAVNQVLAEKEAQRDALRK